MKETRIPTRADMPPYLLVWSSDECMPVLLGLGIGIMLNQVFICTTVGLVVAHFYRKFRDLHPWLPLSSALLVWLRIYP